VLDNAVQVSLDCVIHCACYSIFWGGGAFFRTRCILLQSKLVHFC